MCWRAGAAILAIRIRFLLRAVDHLQVRKVLLKRFTAGLRDTAQADVVARPAPQRFNRHFFASVLPAAHLKIEGSIVGGML